MSIDLIESVFQKQKEKVRMQRSLPLNARIELLKKLRTWIHTNRALIHEAMYADFKKPSAEVDGIELFHVLNEIKYALENISQWSAPKKIDAPLTMLGTRSFIQYEARGVCLIISPWNYPFSLCVGPLVSALAAGNHVIIKPSELTPHVSLLIRKMTAEIFDAELVCTFEGDQEVSQKLLSLPFDHIFFTGNPAIGKIVMKAAAENLASVTLELGGKSPTIITASANIKDAAQRTVVSKFVNNGQTCVAPDYVLVDEKIASSFKLELIAQLKTLFTENGSSFEASPYYARIVNDRHFNRLNELLKDTLDKGGVLEFGGNIKAEDRFIHPTILSNVSSTSRILEEEIFGPILPIMTYKNIDEAIAFVNDRPKALALYIFTNEKSVQDKVLNNTSSGGACINECAIHFLHHHLPFGGVNGSGMGKSHGHYGFLSFTNEKPVMKQRSGFTSVKAFYPPYTPMKQKLMNLFLKLF